jgi:hypothetical protein
MVVAVVGLGFFGFRYYRCRQKSAALRRQVESIKHDAQETLKIGTKKADLDRFFAAHNIPFSIVESQAYGSIQTTGCAPFGCGTDAAVIFVRVKLDEQGFVMEEPTVRAMYTNCL